MFQIKVVEKNTHFMFSNFFPENRAVYEIMSKMMMKPGSMTHARYMLDKRPHAR
jgi:hypothetical protein